MNRYSKEKSSLFGVILCIALVIGLSMTIACGGGSRASTGLPPPSPLTISPGQSLPNGNVGAAYGNSGSGALFGGFLVTATGGATPYTWSWAPAAGSSAPPGLNIATASDGSNYYGQIVGAPAVAGTFSVVVTVTDSAGAKASATFSIKIGAPLPLSITTTSPLSDGTVNRGYFNDLFAMGGVQPYTWSLAAGSSLPTNLTVGTIGNISGTPTALGTFTFSVMVSDSETPAMTATAKLSITVNTLLFGDYAFLFNGFDANGAVAAAGGFTADGQGGITGGVEDINRHVPGPATNVSFTGSYSIGTDNRGTLTMTNSLGTSTFPFTIRSSGDKARFVELDASGTRGSGVIEKTNPSACTLAAINGDFAFGISGDDINKGRVAMAGRFTSDAAGNLSSGLLDEDDAGVVSSKVAWTGTYAAPAISGPRCTATFTPTGLPGRNFALYPASSGEAFLVEVDPVATGVPLTAGRVLSQIGPSGPGTFTNASLGFQIIGGLTGFSAGASVPDVQLVFFSPDGMGNVTITQDENKGGVVTTGTVLKGTYNVEPDGRVTLTAGKNSPVLYLVNTNGIPYVGSAPPTGNVVAFVVGTDDAGAFGLLKQWTQTGLNGGPLDKRRSRDTSSSGRRRPPARTSLTSLG